MHFDVVLSEFIHPCSKKRRRAQFSIRAELTRLSECTRFRCACVHALQTCVRKSYHTARECATNNPECLKCSPCAFGQCLYRVPDTWDWTRMHALAVMHRRILCENVDSVKIKVPFYTTDIDMLRVTSMHRIAIHCIDIDELLHP